MGLLNTSLRQQISLSFNSVRQANICGFYLSKFHLHTDNNCYMVLTSSVTVLIRKFNNFEIKIIRLCTVFTFQILLIIE